MEIRPVFFSDDKLFMLDQRLLPASETLIEYTDHQGVAQGIRDMVVRGAPAIGIAAAYGVALAALRAPDDAVSANVHAAADTLIAARPTAVNLAWAVKRMIQVMEASSGLVAPELRRRLIQEADAILEEDVRMNRAMGEHGQVLLPSKGRVMTHCNAGALATGGFGTALGVIRAAKAAGKDIAVVSCETRPYLQGARLTCWEMVHDGFDVTLITDNSAAWQMSRGLIDAVIVGADRIARNGDTANKIGTLSHAIAARRFNIPFYVAAPCSTLDPDMPDGTRIPIEERPADEVLCIRGTRIAADGVRVLNPSFDVTPWSLISAIITETGIHRPGPDGYHF